MVGIALVRPVLPDISMAKAFAIVGLSESRERRHESSRTRKEIAYERLIAAA